MAVKFAVNPFFWAAAALVLAADEGATAEVAFKVKFRRLKTSEHKLLVSRLAAGGRAPATAVAERQEGAEEVQPITDAELLDLVVLDWKGLDDENGSPVTYSHAERTAANEDWPGLEAAMVRSYFDHAFPNPRAAAKNSEAPPATS